LKPGAAKDASARLGEPPPDESALLEPATNLRLGASYLQLLIERYAGDREVALAAYFKGPGWVGSMGGVEGTRRYLQSPSEVSLYIMRILDVAERMRRRAES
jgi:soluble lytic murein transglycosylase-like protein